MGEKQKERVSEKEAIGRILSGVSVRGLADMFGLSDHMVRTRLRGVPPTRVEGRVSYYAIDDAAPLLVTPRVTAEAVRIAIEQDAIPPELTKRYWDAVRQRQRVMEAAGDLWRTDKVLDVLSSLARAIRGAVTTWTDNVDRASALSPTQKESLIQQTDALLRDVHKILVEAPRRGRTPSIREDIVTSETQEVDDLGGVV